MELWKSKQDLEIPRKLSNTIDHMLTRKQYDYDTKNPQESFLFKKIWLCKQDSNLRN